MNGGTIVHFGAGALGRGMVVPLLFESGYDVVVVDTNEELNHALNRDRGYALKLSDEDPARREREIRIVDAVSPVADKEKLARYLSRANVVTTSVRRDNLVRVARTLADTWGNEDRGDRMVICCENIERVGAYFTGLWDRIPMAAEQRIRLERVAVPDTIVDRICAADWPESTAVTSERFHECAVDAKSVARTGIDLIAPTERIDRDFARKRLLLNTYADAISFLAREAGMTYLYEAAQSDEINRAVEPYMALLQTMLVLKFGSDEAELNAWRSKYKQRLCNAGIPRRLDTVARDIASKLAPGERFVWPLIQLLEYGEDVQNGVEFLAHLIRVGFRLENPAYGRGQIGTALQASWGVTPAGRRLFEQVVPYL